MVFAVSIPKFNKSASFCLRNTALSYYWHTSVQKCLCTDTRSWFCASWNRRTVFAAKIWLLLVLSDLWLWKLLAFLTFYSCSFCFYSYSEIWWTSSCYLWGIDMSKKEKLISLIVLVCLVLLVTVIGYQKYHENISPTKESSTASTVETEPISSQKE